RFADAAPAGAVHGVEQLGFGERQIAAIGLVELTFESEVSGIVGRKMWVGNFHVHAFESLPRQLFDSGQRRGARLPRQEIEADVRGSPPWKRATQNLDPEAAKREPGEITYDLAVFPQLGNNRLSILCFADVMDPLTGLEHGAVGEAVERLPVGV